MVGSWKDNFMGMHVDSEYVFRFLQNNICILPNMII